MNPHSARLAVHLLLASLCLASSFAAEPTAIPLWPGRAPGETVVLPAENNQTLPTDALVAGRPIIKLGNVSDPTITLYRPDPKINTGTTVLVCPGGGYNILAMDIEGTEICQWLNSIGVTAALLKYRVPRRDGRAPHAAPLEDGQRALGIIRSRAKEWSLDPQRIGVIGFSAGGYLAAMLSNHSQTRTYPKVDSSDAVSCRPDFCVLIYPAYLIDEAHPELLAANLTPEAELPPRTFLTMTQDDNLKVENVLTYYLALRREKVPAELHLYARGGHGYGLRQTDDAVTTWPDRVRLWLKSEGLLRPMPLP